MLKSNSYWILTTKGEKLIKKEEWIRSNAFQKMVDSCSQDEIKELMILLDEKMEKS